MHKQTKGCILLLLCAMIWGAAFVAQSEGMQYVGPFTMGATRFFLAGLVLLPVIRVLDRKGWSQNRPVTKKDKKRQLAAGAICGVLLFAATTLQQFGLLDTTVGKSGFVTALYIVFVPILGALMGRRAGLKVWLCALAAVFGMYLLCVGSGFSIAYGDLLTLGCAVLFTFHICYISAVSPRMDGVRLSCVQFLVCSALSAVGMLLFEAPDWDSILQCWWPIVYAGVFSGGVAYTFQIIGERDVQPALASLLIGGVIMGKGGIFTRAVGVVLGSILFRLVYTIALRFQMPAFMLKLISSVIVVLAISIPYLKKQMPMIKRRMGIKTQKGGV